MDRLNNLSSKYPAIDYDEYFDEMDIPDEDKEKRKELAEKIDDVYYWLFAYILALLSTGEVIDTESLILSVQYRLGDLLNVNVNYVSEHVVRVAGETVEATVEHKEDDYYFSPQRATDIAAGEAHTYYEYEELQQAYEDGKTKKTWHTQLDRRVRNTHREMEGKTIPLEELFEVNGSFLIVPKDTENGASLREVSGCRCWVTFS